MHRPTVKPRDARQRFTFPSDPNPDESEPRFAIGTVKMDKLPFGAIDERETSPALELGTIPHAMFVIGANGRIADVNARAEAVVGYARTELVGELLERIISDLARSPMIDSIELDTPRPIHRG